MKEEKFVLIGFILGIFTLLFLFFTVNAAAFTGCSPTNSICTTACEDLFNFNYGSHSWSYFTMTSWQYCYPELDFTYVYNDYGCDKYLPAGNGECAEAAYYNDIWCPSVERKGSAVTSSDCVCQYGSCTPTDYSYINFNSSFFTEGAVTTTTTLEPTTTTSTTESTTTTTEEPTTTTTTLETTITTTLAQTTTSTIATTSTTLKLVLPKLSYHYVSPRSILSGKTLTTKVTIKNGSAALDSVWVFGGDSLWRIQPAVIGVNSMPVNTSGYVGNYSVIFRVNDTLGNMVSTSGGYVNIYTTTTTIPPKINSFVLRCELVNAGVDYTVGTYPVDTIWITRNGSVWDSISPTSSPAVFNLPTDGMSGRYNIVAKLNDTHNKVASSATKTLTVSW